MSQHTIVLAGETDSDGFRREARMLLAALVAPEAVTWRIDPQARTRRWRRPAVGSAPRATASAGSTHPLVPRSFMSLSEMVILHRAPARFGLLYRLLWRLVHEPGLQRDALDADRLQALHMAQAVRRDMHKMKTFLQFSEVDDPEGGSLQLAWFDPDHHILEAVAPFFARRLGNQRWAILTPLRSVRWDGQLLELAPGAGAAAPLAALPERYRTIFGPAETPHAVPFRSDRGSEAARSSLPDSAP